MLKHLIILSILAIAFSEFYLYPEASSEQKQHFNVKIQQEETLIVSIQENPSTGYIWIIHQQTSNLKVNQKRIYPDVPPGYVGYPIQTEFHITCEGSCTEEFISFVNARPWEYDDFMANNKDAAIENITCATWSFEVHIMYQEPADPLLNTFIDL